jgi:hypothetical protein
VQPGIAGPVLQVLALVVQLGRHRVFTRRVDARVDAVEDAADQDRPPLQFDLLLRRQRLDVVERQVGPRAAAVEEELDHRRPRAGARPLRQPGAGSASMAAADIGISIMVLRVQPAGDAEE